MHMQTDRDALLRRLNRLLGQLTAVRGAIEKGEDRECYAVMQQLAAARGALDGLTRLFLEGHIQRHVVGAKNATARAEGGEELIQTLRSFLR
jgi:DNA-binding FrmR family transcriptional regulator